MDRQTRSVVLLVTIALLSGSAFAFSGEPRGGKGGKSPKPTNPPAPCYPAADATLIDDSGVRTIVSPACATGSVTFEVPAKTAPWDQDINYLMIFNGVPSDYAATLPPIAQTLAAFGVAAGQYIGIACIGGSVNGGGLPDSGCDGLTSFEPNDDIYQPACNSFYPSAYVDPSNFPVYAMQLIGAFTDDSGVVTGKPFAITSGPQNVQVPTGASKVQVGFNDCRFADNDTRALTFKLTY
jgi:hypothetical protein